MAKSIANIFFSQNLLSIISFRKIDRKYLQFPIPSFKNIFVSQNRSDIPSFRKIDRKYLLSQITFCNIDTPFRKTNQKNLISAESIENIFFSQYLRFFKLIANIFFSQYLHFAKPSSESIFFSQNRSQIPSFRKIDRKYLLSQITFCNIDPSFRKTDRKNLLLAKSIANIFFSQNLLSIISFRKIGRKYLQFPIPSFKNIFVSQNRSDIPSFRKIDRKYLLSQITFCNIDTPFRKTNQKNLISAESIENIFFSQYLRFFKLIANIFFSQYLRFFKLIAKIFFSQYLHFAKPSSESIFFSQNRSQIPSFRKIDRKYLLSQITFCNIDPSFRKTDRKNLLLAKSIANIFFSQNLLSIISFRKNDRKYRHFAIPSFENIFVSQNRSQIPSFRKIDCKYLLLQITFCNIDPSFRKTNRKKSYFCKIDRKYLLFAKPSFDNIFSQNRSQIPSFRNTFFRKYLRFAKSIANTFIS